MAKNRPSRRRRRARITAWVLVVVWFTFAYLIWFARFEGPSPGNISGTPPFAATDSLQRVGLLGYQERYTIIIDVDYDTFEQTMTKEHGHLFVWSVILTAISAVCFWWIPIFLAHDRTRPGNCTECNYDLRGTTSNQCPECGAIDSLKA